MTKNELELKNGYQNLPKFIRYALAAYKRRGFIGGIISGEFAKGKTVTAMKLGAKILEVKYGYTPEQALEKIIDEHLVFTSDEFILLTEKLYEGYDWENMSEKDVLKTKYKIRYPVLIWDDAGIHASTKKDRLDPSDAFDIHREYDTIRDITSCMILTLPEEAELMKSLRSYRSNYFIELATPHDPKNYDDRIMYFYRYERDNRTGNMRRKLKWHTDAKDAHSIHIDDWAYGKYDKKRTLAKLEVTKKYKQKKEEREIEKQYRLLKKKILVDKWKKEIKEIELLEES